MAKRKRKASSPREDLEVECAKKEAAAASSESDAEGDEDEECCDDDDMAKEEEAKSDSSSASSIQLKAWDPDTPYLKEMKQNEQQAYDTYLAQREVYGQSPAFYLDCCEFFFQRGERVIGLRVLTTLLELGIDDPQLYRVVGYKLDQHGEFDQAVILFDKVLALRPKEPQSFRDLALVVAKMEQYQRALELLNEVVLGNWDYRFSEIEVTALVEANRIVAFAQAEGVPVNNPIDPRLLHPFDLDMRISMAWDTDNSDIDIHVIEPNGEEAYYGHKNTVMGGLVSRDFTQGYGPEEYMLKKAVPGTYKVRARYYSSQAQTLTGGTTVLLSVFTNYGRPEIEEAQLITVRLQSSCDIIDIGEITFSEKQQRKQPQKKPTTDADAADDQGEGEDDGKPTSPKGKEKGKKIRFLFF